MRIVPSLLAIALAGTTFTLSAATIAEKLPPHDVELADLLDRPHAFENLRVRFKCTFVQTSGVFSPNHTRFNTNLYMNFIVWDDDAQIWDATERSQGLVTVYYPKREKQATIISGMPKYTVVEIVGEVASNYRDEPWILCHTVTAVENAGSFTDNAIYHMEQGLALDAEGRHELADEHMASALTANLPGRLRLQVQVLQAENLIRGKSYDRASAVLTEALASLEDDETLPRDAEAKLRFLRAKSSSEQGERLRTEGKSPKELFEAAVADASRAIELDPDDGDIYAVHGICLAGLERFDEAKRQCERAIRLRPDNAEVRWYLGRILDLQASYDEAIAVLKQAIDLAPKDYRLHKAIARTYYNRSTLGQAGAAIDIVTALREYDIAIRLNPADSDLHYWSGVVMEVAAQREMMIKDKLQDVKATYDMAIERFRACLEVDEKYTEAHLRLGYRLREKQQHNEAADHLKRAIELEPSRFQLYQELGRFLWDLGRRAEARDIYAGYQKREPAHLDTLYALGHLSYELAALDKEVGDEAAARRMQEYQRSVDWHLVLLKVQPNYAQSYAEMVECYLELGKHREAIEASVKAMANVATFPPEQAEAETARVHRFKGLALAALDQQHEAALALDGRTDGVQDARMPLTLGWALSVYDPNRVKDETKLDQSGARLQALAAQALALAPDNRSATELLGWGLYKSGDGAGAEKALAPLAGADQPVIAWRLGMAIYAQGAGRYAAAKPLLEQARSSLRSRSLLHASASDEIRAALRAIEVHARDTARNAAAAERQRKIDEAAAEKKRAAEAAAEKKRLDEEARKAKQAQ